MIIYAIVMLIVLPAAAFAFGLCRAAAKPTPKPDRDKILLNALNKTLDDYHAKRGTFAEWKKQFRAIGKREGYTAAQIKEYGLHIAYAIKVGK